MSQQTPALCLSAGHVSGEAQMTFTSFFFQTLISICESRQSWWRFILALQGECSIELRTLDDSVMKVIDACELASCAEQTACEKSPVEPLMDVNSRLLLFAALSFQMLRKRRNENVRATKALVG